MALLLFKVSIPSWCDWEDDLISCIFIPTTVSIPSWCDWEIFIPTTWESILSFQFHHGAIGRGQPRSCDRWISMFQFHHGAIGSVLPSVHITFVRGFNSIMVRLGDGLSETALNDLLVSIPSWCDWEHPSLLEETLNNKFQFHHGAIGRFFLSIISGCHCRFNSIMVRLGEYQFYLLLRFLISFNSIMVRLGVRHTRRSGNFFKVSIPSWCDWEISYNG